MTTEEKKAHARKQWEISANVKTALESLIRDAEQAKDTAEFWSVLLRHLSIWENAARVWYNKVLDPETNYNEPDI
jgi:hypothetical protein